MNPNQHIIGLTDEQQAFMEGVLKVRAPKGQRDAGELFVWLLSQVVTKPDSDLDNLKTAAFPKEQP